MGCNRGRVRFSLTAEGTLDRSPMTDNVPNSGTLTYRR